jgi:DNA (cytosine-5)-methyltransferase 1
VNAKDYGVPAERRRLFIVGVRRDVGSFYWFPEPTHGPHSPKRIPYVSHGDTIAALPLDAKGEYYARDNPANSWWYMSRNRKRRWEDPSLAIVANWRHAPLHPASPRVEFVSRDADNRSMQVWRFSAEYDHVDRHPERPMLSKPRRLSWREAALLQTFPSTFVPSGAAEAKFSQVGNAVPPLLMERLVSPLVDGSGLRDEPFDATSAGAEPRPMFDGINGVAVRVQRKTRVGSLP